MVRVNLKDLFIEVLILIVGWFNVPLAVGLCFCRPNPSAPEAYIDVELQNSVTVNGKHESND